MFAAWHLMLYVFIHAWIGFILYAYVMPVYDWTIHYIDGLSDERGKQKTK